MQLSKIVSYQFSFWKKVKKMNSYCGERRKKRQKRKSRTKENTISHIFIRYFQLLSSCQSLIDVIDYLKNSISVVKIEK